MEIWLVQNEERLRLPITPFFNPERSMNNQQINLNEVGTVNLAGNKGLMTMTLESFFPNSDYYFLESSDVNLDPYFYVDKIEKMQLSKNPVRVIITETPYNLEMLIDSFSPREEDGTGDVYYTISLSEYVRIETHKAYSEKEKSVITKENIARFGGTAAISTALLTVGKYDTAWTMAKKLLGDGDKYKELLKKNGLNSVSKLKEGMELKI